MAAPLTPWSKTLVKNIPGFCRSSATVIHVQRRYYEPSTRSTAEVAVAPRRRAAPTASSSKTVTITRAMRAYMERVQAHNDMMAAEVQQFESGKRHLANIMGKSPNNFTQEDVDKAIEYLLPCGIYDKRARPMLKEPKEVFPLRKAAQLGSDGRPLHWMYFTGKPNYYEMLYRINWKMEDLKTLEDLPASERKKMEKGSEEARTQFLNIDIPRSEWTPKEELQIQLVEKLKDEQYDHLLVLLERLLVHPLSHTQRDFIMSHRKQLEVQALTIDVPEIEKDEDGRTFARAEGKKKRCPAWVKVYKPGTGKITINGQEFGLFFKNHLYREALMVPLVITDTLNKVDIEAKVDLVVERWIYNNFHKPEPEHFVKGPSSYLGAIRLGTARALTAFVTPKVREDLRLAGLLTECPRVKLRKWPGQWKARKKFTWKAR